MWFIRRKPKPDMESQKALYLAEKHLEQVKAREPEVQKVVEASREFRRRNHFAEDLTALIKGGKLA